MVIVLVILGFLILSATWPVMRTKRGAWILLVLVVVLFALHFAGLI